MRSKYHGTTSGLIFLAFLASPTMVHAQNDCRAVVVPVRNGVTTAGAVVTIAFDVKTECDASTGQFTYSYRTSGNPNKGIERNSMSWSANDGKAFKVREEFTPGSGVKIQDVKVLTVRSTKVK